MQDKQPQPQATTSGLLKKVMGIFSPRILLMAAVVTVVVVLVMLMSAGKKPQAASGGAADPLPSIEEAARLGDADEIVLAPQQAEEVPVTQDVADLPPAHISDPLDWFDATLDEISIQTPAADTEAAQTVEAVETVAVQETLPDTAAVASDYPSWMMVQTAATAESATGLSLSAGEDVVAVHSRVKDQVDEQQALIQRMQQQDMQIDALQKQLTALQQALGEQQQWNHTLQAGLYRSGILNRMPAPATDGRAAVLAADNFTPAAGRVATPLPAAAPPRVSNATSAAKRLASQIQIASVDMWNGQPSVVLMVKGSDGFQSLSPGESINGMTLRSADAARQSAVFVVNGREVTIGRDPQ